MRVSGEAGCAPKRFKRCHSKASLGETMARAMREAESRDQLAPPQHPQLATRPYYRHTQAHTPHTGTARLYFGVVRWAYEFFPNNDFDEQVRYLN